MDDHALKHYLSLLQGQNWFAKLDWETFLGIDAPYADTGFIEKELQDRYHRNGYDWDIHGRLYIPDREILPGYSFVLIHGGGVNEFDFQVTPDGRPGLARVLAAQGFRVLTPSFPGLYPPGGEWKAPVGERKPFYLLDRNLNDDEIRDRMLKATYQVYMQGISLLVEKHLGHQKLFSAGHSTGGPMAADLYQYISTAKVAGIVGWGSGGYEGWLAQWREASGMPSVLGRDPAAKHVTGGMRHRTVEDHRYSAEYEDLPEVTPWGRLEERFELVGDTTPMFNPNIQDASHGGDTKRFIEYQAATGLPMEEYIGHFKEPDPNFLRNLKVLLLVGENDRGHWKTGGQHPEEKQEGFVAKLYAEKSKGAHLVLLPKYTHMGHWALHNEKFVYLWLWAIKSGYFGDLH